MLFVFDIIGQLLDEFIYLSGFDSVDKFDSLLKRLLILGVIWVAAWQDVFINVLYLLEDGVVEPYKSIWVGEYLLTRPFYFQLFFAQLKDITDHLLDACTDYVEVIVFVELVAWVKYIVNDLHILGWVADLILNNPSFIHEELMINIYILCPQVKSVSPEIV